jgi:hypothetical protein
MDAVEDYARRWKKREVDQDPELESLSDWGRTSRDVLRFSEFRTMRNHLSETLMLNDILITSDYMSRWVV